MRSLQALLALSCLLALPLVGAGCSVLVDSELNSRTGGEDAGLVGETCTFDAQCISFDPFNCNRVCGPEGRCMDGAAPDGTRCGTGAMQHCVAQACVQRMCGDGYLDRNATPPEYCDDGNDNPDDGCNNVCTRSCAPPAPANCADTETCNGAESCADIAGMMLCRSTAGQADDTPCNTSDGASGTCQANTCVPN